MIQVDMLGTVNIAIALIRKATITVPKERMPLPANTVNLATMPPALLSFSISWYLLISESIANCCTCAQINKMR